MNPSEKPIPRYEPPYRELFIYYLKGRLGRDQVLEDERFIGNWEEGDESFLFFTSDAEAYVGELLRRQPDLSLQDRYRMSYEQWQGEVVAPFRVGRLQVVPPWHADAGRLDDGGILLDPGVVFGTGTHPTTNDCLTALQRAFEYSRPSRVLDLGTGSGLLALAAARLGAKSVLAVDLNPLATQTARRNAVLNRMTDRILVVQGNATNFMDIAGDLVLSNIHYDVMRQLVAAPGFVRQKQFVLSGLLRSQAREIESLLQRQGVNVVHKWERDGTWHTYYGRRAA